MNKIRSYDVFNKGDGDVISVCTMLPSRRALEQLRTVELSRITDVLRDFSVLRHPPLFLFEYCVNFLIDVMPWVDELRQHAGENGAKHTVIFGRCGRTF